MSFVFLWTTGLVFSLSGIPRIVAENIVWYESIFGPDKVTCTGTVEDIFTGPVHVCIMKCEVSPTCIGFLVKDNIPGCSMMKDITNVQKDPSSDAMLFVPKLPNVTVVAPLISFGSIPQKCQDLGKTFYMPTSYKQLLVLILKFMEIKPKIALPVNKISGQWIRLDNNNVLDSSFKWRAYKPDNGATEIYLAANLLGLDDFYDQSASYTFALCI